MSRGAALDARPEGGSRRPWAARRLGSGLVVLLALSLQAGILDATRLPLSAVASGEPFNNGEHPAYHYAAAALARSGGFGAFDPTFLSGYPAGVYALEGHYLLARIVQIGRWLGGSTVLTYKVVFFGFCLLPLALAAASVDRRRVGWGGVALAALLGAVAFHLDELTVAFWYCGSAEIVVAGFAATAWVRAARRFLRGGEASPWRGAVLALSLASLPLLSMAVVPLSALAVASLLAAERKRSRRLARPTLAAAVLVISAYVPVFIEELRYRGERLASGFGLFQLGILEVPGLLLAGLRPFRVQGLPGTTTVLGPLFLGVLCVLVLADRRVRAEVRPFVVFGLLLLSFALSGTYSRLLSNFQTGRNLIPAGAAWIPVVAWLPAVVRARIRSRDWLRLGVAAAIGVLLCVRASVAIADGWGLYRRPIETGLEAADVELVDYLEHHTTRDARLLFECDWEPGPHALPALLPFYLDRPLAGSFHPTIPATRQLAWNLAAGRIGSQPVREMGREPLDRLLELENVGWIVVRRAETARALLEKELPLRWVMQNDRYGVLEVARPHAFASGSRVAPGPYPHPGDRAWKITGQRGSSSVLRLSWHHALRVDPATRAVLGRLPGSNRVSIRWVEDGESVRLRW